MGKSKAAAPVATFTPPAKVSAEDRKGPSTVEHPVATTWLVCLTATHAAGGTMPARRDLMAAAVAAGVGYNTSRTQVQKYRQWVGAGSDPATLPRGITVTA